MSLEGDAAKGARVKKFLDDPLMHEAIKSVKEDFIDEWMRTGTGDTEEREQIYLALGALDRLIRKLGLMVADGQVAQAEIDKENSQ